MIRISASHFVAGLVLVDDFVVRAAPIVKYMLGWTGGMVDNYCSYRGWHVERLP